jgi:hypothetical protein
MHAIQQLAQQYLDEFELKTRANNSTYYCRKENNYEDDLHQLIYSAHNGMAPDDYRYYFIVEALRDLIEADICEDDSDIDFHDITNEIEAEIYNNKLCQWLSSHAYRPGYCDEAIEELGVAPISIIEYIQYGYIKEKTEVYFSVYNTLEALLSFEAA